MADNSSGQIGVFQAQVVAIALAGSTVVYIIVALLLRAEGMLEGGGFVGLPAAQATTLGAVFLVVGAVGVAVSLFLRKTMVAGLTAETDGVTARARIAVIALAICDLAGILGIVHVFLCGSMAYAWLLWSESLGGSIFLVPSRAWLEGRQ